MPGFGASGWGGTLASGGGGGGGGISITNFTPVAGQSILPSTHLTFDAIAAAGFNNIVISVLYPETGAHEMIFDGTTFAPNFIQGSTKAPIANGFHFDVARRGGWSLTPQITGSATDSNGNLSRF